uniref:Centromere protein M n=1 Tax=Oryzias sinensis TaxID=183150 RepID=A0A8C7ZMW5_9TELE
MSRLNPFAKLPGLNTASVLLVESEEHFQQSLAEALVEETSVTVNVRLAKSFPLPIENDESRPRIDLVVFIINLTSELSPQFLRPSRAAGCCQEAGCVSTLPPAVCRRADPRRCDKCCREAPDHPEGSSRLCSLHYTSVPVEPDQMHSATRHRPAQLRLTPTNSIYVISFCVHYLIIIYFYMENIFLEWIKVVK